MYKKIKQHKIVKKKKEKKISERNKKNPDTRVNNCKIERC